MNNVLIASMAAALAAPVPLLAHDEPVIVLRHEMLAFAESDRHDHGDFTFNLRDSMGTMFAPRMGPGKVVKGAPYSAEVVTETNQSLADGNVISRKTAGAVHRDGEGRTRQETPAEGRSSTVFLNDPVAGTHFILAPGSKRAIATAPRVMSFRNEQKDRQVVRLGGTEVRIEDGKVFLDGKDVTGGKVEVQRGGKNIVIEKGRITIDGKEILAGSGPHNVIVKRVESGDGTRREEVRVQVVRAGEGGDPIPPIPPLPPLPMIAPLALLPGVHTLRFESTAKLGKGVTTSLGTKDFDGVKAEGKSTTWTIPAGEIGNRNAINVMSETWYSPELQVTVYSRHSDPRTGESIYRLAGIRRGEPAADLFRVPEDYKLRSRAPKG